jgi:hypothetical protein
MLPFLATNRSHNVSLSRALMLSLGVCSSPWTRRRPGR